MRHRLILMTLAAALAAGPALAADYQRLDPLTGAAPNRTLYAFKVDAKPDAARIAKVVTLELYETARNKVGRIVTSAEINCQARTIKPTSIGTSSINGASLSSLPGKGPPKPIKPGSPEDRYRAAACDGDAKGFKPFQMNYTRDNEWHFYGVDSE